MAGPEGLIIAIDGVVGAGKSSTAKQVAQELGYRHIDTGAMYRAVTLAAQRRDIEAQNHEALAALLQEIHIGLEPQHRGGRVLLDGEDVSAAIRQPDITRRVGAYADLPLVRRALVAQQQAMGALGGVVADGRDAGSVVFPNADLKILMVASLEERARRRHLELTQKGIDISLAQVTTDIEARDRADTQRDYGAQLDPSEVLTLNTTDLTFDDQVARIVAWARQRGAR